MREAVTEAAKKKIDRKNVNNNNNTEKDDLF